MQGSPLQDSPIPERESPMPIPARADSAAVPGSVEAVPHAASALASRYSKLEEVVEYALGLEVLKTGLSLCWMTLKQGPSRSKT